METIIKNENQYPKEDYYIGMNIDLRHVMIDYGRYLEKKEDLINEFKDRLLYGDYKVILYNGQVPILEDDTRIIDLILQDIDENTIVELNGDKLTIHIKNEIIELTGYEEMSDLEIFARNYLCECGNELIVKDNVNQVEMREDNFYDIIKEDYYNKCKDIVNIEDFLGYNEESSIYKMNWDCILIEYRSGKCELWQRP